MAINIPNWSIDPYSDFNFTYKDIPIGGKLVTGTIRIPEHKMVDVRSDHELKQYLKSSMAQQMSEYMISNGLVEFTQMKDQITFDIIVKARCYLAPNDQVKILRMHYADT
jgi:hypothetical protein